MKRARRSTANSRWQISIGGEEIQLFRAQWFTMLLLGPAWTFLKPGVAKAAVWAALQKRGWVEVKRGELWVAARLTAEGLRIRDMIHIREAERTNAALYDSRGHRRQVTRDRKNPIPTTRPRL